MSKQLTLQIIAVISFIGILFSGVLSYRELFLGSCNLSFVSCGTNTGPVLGVPACIYGFVMYTIVFIFAIWGICSKNK